MNENDDVIETSEDTENDDSGGLYPYDPTQADIDIRESPHSIYDLMRQYKDGRLIVHQIIKQAGHRSKKVILLKR